MEKEGDVEQFAGARVAAGSEPAWIAIQSRARRLHKGSQSSGDGLWEAPEARHAQNKGQTLRLDGRKNKASKSVHSTEPRRRATWMGVGGRLRGHDEPLLSTTAASASALRSIYGRDPGWRLDLVHSAVNFRIN